MTCYQLTVTGSGTLEPKGVTFPEAYSKTGPGLGFSIHANLDSYPAPGPKLIAGGTEATPKLLTFGTLSDVPAATATGGAEAPASSTAASSVAASSAAASSVAASSAAASSVAASSAASTPVAAEATSTEPTGFGHNAVTPIGMQAPLPIIMSHHIQTVSNGWFWMGGGEVDLKLGLPVDAFVQAYRPLVLDCTMSCW